MATAKEKAKEWNCSPRTVTEYCSSGIIPPAEKNGRFGGWEIPESWPKPPMRRHQLCFLLDTIDLIHLGAVYGELEMGYPREKILDGYRYLVSSGFMTSFDLSDLDNDLGSAYVTNRGVALIESENAAIKTSVKFTARARAFASLGIASVEAGCEVSNG